MSGGSITSYSVTGVRIVKIEFYWSDLSPEKQEEIIALLGDNQNWDIIPFFAMEINEPGQEFQNQ